MLFLLVRISVRSCNAWTLVGVSVPMSKPGSGDWMAAWRLAMAALSKSCGVAIGIAVFCGNHEMVLMVHSLWVLVMYTL